MVISLEISFQFTRRGITLNISGQGVPQNSCRWKEGKIYRIKFHVGELGVHMGGLCGRDLQTKLMREVVLQGAMMRYR